MVKMNISMMGPVHHAGEPDHYQAEKALFESVVAIGSQVRNDVAAALSSIPSLADATWELKIRSPAIPAITIRSTGEL